MECRDRYFMMAVLSFAGDELHFEAVDRTGVYPITMQYAAKCGYSVSVLSQLGRVELRASYFSCHTDNKVNVRSEITCSSGTQKDNWNTLKPAHSSTTSDWQVMFQKAEEALPPMNLSEAQKRGHVFDLTDGRLVFRTPYGQPDSFSTTVNGVPVEVVHATLFSRQSWVVLMVDLVAACSMHEGSYDDSGYMVWDTPEALYPGPNMRVNIGLNGDLMEQLVAEERGLAVEKLNNTIQISIPYNAEGGYRKSFVTGGLYEYYIFNLYLEQILVDEDHVETRLRFHRTLATPLLPCPVFTENRTVIEERVFTVYLGDVPEDVELTAVQMNGYECALPFTNTSTHTISKVVQPNNTHGYTLKVPFDDPVVIHKFSKEHAVVHHQLSINYTLTVQPENEPYYHLTSVMALTDVSPPTFDAVCSESGIRFRLDHSPFDYMWDICIGSDPLTSELAAQHGYIMSNDSRSLLLEDLTLRGFLGTFEILVRDHETSEVQSSSVKTCPFTMTEFIVCSTDGKMTVVADLSLVVQSGGIPARTNLVDKNCRPKEVDGTRAFFSFPLNSCGSVVKLSKEYVTYKNEIFFTKKLHAVKNQSDPSIDTDRVTIQCTYPLAGLHRLFSKYRFESDTAGVGRIIHSMQSTEACLLCTAGLQSPTIKPIAAVKTTPATRRPVRMQSAFHPPARYIKVSKFQYLPTSMRKMENL
ncbi:hypothetical protein PAMP_015738 [Pampus punctatissimus]